MVVWQYATQQSGAGPTPPRGLTFVGGTFTVPSTATVTSTAIVWQTIVSPVPAA